MVSGQKSRNFCRCNLWMLPQAGGHHPATAVAIMKRGKKWPLNGLLHLNRDLVAAAATAAASAAEGIPDHHLRFEQRHRSYSMDGRGRRRREWIPRRNGAGEQILHFYAWLPGKAAKPRTILRPAHSLPPMHNATLLRLPPSFPRSLEGDYETLIVACGGNSAVTPSEWPLIRQYTKSK